MSRWSEDEEVQVIKEWWDKNGQSVLTSILTVTVVWAGWTYWANTKFENASNGSTTFQILQINMDRGTFGDVAREGLKLMDEQPESPYSSAVGLMLAKFYFEKGEQDDAIKQFNWVIEHALNNDIKIIAMIRLANIQVEAKTYDDALTTLSVTGSMTLSGAQQANIDYAYADVFLAQSNFIEARRYLTNVIENKETAANLIQLAQLQLNDIAE